MFRAPTISGTMKMPTASMIGTANRNIIAEPCIEKTCAY